MKIAFVFPGQGSQSIGMGLDFYNAFRVAREIFDDADNILKFPLTKLIFDGPREELQKTENTQPALLVSSIAMCRIFEEQSGIKASVAAGHSLGEFSAYVYSGVLDFGTGLRVVRKRGELMADAGARSNGIMAAIIGLSDFDVISICDEVSKNNIVVPANFNCPGQVVISGDRAGVDAVISLAKERKAKMAVRLKVSGAFHSPLIEDAGLLFRDFLSTVETKEAIIPVISNVTTDVVDSKDIRSSWVSQLTSPVLWTKSILKMLDMGVDTFVEIGSGKVLQGLIKKTSRRARVFGVNSVESLNKTIEELKKQLASS